MSIHNIPSCLKNQKDIPIMPPDLALLSTVIGSNYPCLELIFMVLNVFEPSKFFCIGTNRSKKTLQIPKELFDEGFLRLPLHLQLLDALLQ